MGSKKLKKKKLKYKKIAKIHKVKSVKQKREGILSFDEEKDPERVLHREIVTYNRSSKNYSPSYDESDDASEVKTFSKIREDYFMYLQTVISDNCAFYDSVVTEETLQNLALELEQNALLACLQIDIYKKSMSRIIRDIRKSTEEKQVHEEVRKLLPDSNPEKTDLKSEKSSANNVEVECYSSIPTISSNRNDDSANNMNFWSEQSNYYPDAYYGKSCDEMYSDNMCNSDQLWTESEDYSSVPDHSGFWGKDIELTNQSNLYEFECTQIVNCSESSDFQNNCSVLKKTDSVSINKSDESESKSEKIDPLLKSRTHLQKLVEKTLNETEKIQRKKREQQERAHIAQILEGDDSVDDRLNDSLSDNENESKENIDETNLMDRLDKMRELFGVEEEDNSTNKSLDKPKPSNKVISISNHSHRPGSWKYEKFIQLHKYSLIAGEMSRERRNINRRIFFKLFGDDSDEEHEVDYSSEEKYKSCCAERISSWVVKYLMPFYHEKRIIGRNVFKTLGHYISGTIVDAIQYPDEWTVKYYVSKFFPLKKRYACDADVFNFQLE